MKDSGSTVGLFGDSIACGLGVRSSRYIEIVARRGNFTLADFAVTGATLRQSWERYIEAGAPPVDVMIIAHGITEPIPRPKPESITFLPERWQRLGWMDPRPYYSSRLSRRTLERVESAARWRVKNLVMRARGTAVLQEQASYLRTLREVLRRLGEQGTQVLLLEPTSIDGKFFPGAPQAQERYWHAAREIGGATALSTRQHLSEWDDYFADHFHPNAHGHRKIADLISARLA